MGDKALKFKFKIEYIPIILFVLATVLYLNIDKTPLDYPSNLKAADAFYHSAMVESILDTKQWNYFDTYISLGQEKALNVQPPLYYINAAVLTLFSNVPAWITIYLLFCISQALFSFVTFLIAKEVFEDDKIGILAASLAILPITVRAWLYSLYIGIWVQIASFLFLLTFLWLFIRYFKRKENWTLIFISICISSVLLTHPMDLFFLIFPTILIGIDLLKNIKKDFSGFVKKGFMFTLIPFVSVLSMLPRILFQWSSQGGDQFKLGFYTPNLIYVSRNYIRGLPFPDLFYIHWIILIIFALGLIQLILNWKKYKIWILAMLYYFVIIYSSVFLVKDPHYFGRARYLTPYFIYPAVGYIVYYMIKKILAQINLKIKEIYVILVIVLIFIGIGIPGYADVVNSMEYEHMTKDKWTAFEWIQANTAKDAKLLFFYGVSETEYMYTKRISALFGIDELNKIITLAAEKNITSTNFTGAWGSDTLRATRRYEISMFEYGDYPEPSRSINLYDFDYIVFYNINDQFKNINYYFASQYITYHGFTPVYDRNNIFILKNERN